nr:unnamed protein product [Callosobruchus analis]
MWQSLCRQDSNIQKTYMLTGRTTILSTFN